MADDKDPKNTKDSNKNQQKESSATSEPVNIEQSNKKPAAENSTSKFENKHQANSTVKAHSESQPPLFNAKPLPKMAAKRNKQGKIVPIIIGLLLLIAIIISAWTLYQQHLFNQNWQQLQTKIDSELAQQTGTIEQSKNASQASAQAIGQTQNQLNQLAVSNRQLNESLFSTQERIKALSGRQRQDWMLAEASYLIKMAQLQLTLQKDKTTAIQLLKTADSRLIEIADNSLLSIRQGIAMDLSDLSLILQPDVVGLSYSLDAINKQIPSLDIAAFQFDPLQQQHSAPEAVEPTEGFDLSEVYQKFLKDFVVIKDHSEPIKPLMGADQRANLNSNIQLALQQAQIAIVQGNESLYQLNIENAILWLTEFFVQNEKTQLLIQQLAQLKSSPIKVNYPQSLNAKKALDEVSQKQVYRWLENSLQEPKSTQPVPAATNLPDSKKTIESEVNQSNDEKLEEDDSGEQSSDQEINP